MLLACTCVYLYKSEGGKEGGHRVTALLSKANGGIAQDTYVKPIVLYTFLLYVYDSLRFSKLLGGACPHFVGTHIDFLPSAY